MKTIYKTLAVCMIVLMLVASFGCRTVTYTDALAADRVFVDNGDTMSDGFLSYRPHLPDNWSYHGDYSYQIGTVKDGNALLASDETGIVVKQRKPKTPLFADMDYIPWIRSDVDLENLSEEDCDVVAEIAKSGECTLSEQAKAEFMNWYHTRRTVEEQITIRGKTVSKIYFAYPALHDLHFKREYLFEMGTDSVRIVDMGGHVLGTFHSDTALYQELNKSK